MTPRARRTTKPKTKAKTEPRRLPPTLRTTGEVLMDRPPQPGALAHRRYIVCATDELAGRNPVVGIVTALCRPPADNETPQPDRYAQVSAGWADHHYHAIACPGCFPEATP